MSSLDLQAPYEPAGDQPQAIDKLVASIQAGNRFQTLWGVTGSGKTFTMAAIIARLNRPALIISHNKTLAAQLYSEFKNFFPRNAVEYFVSYYDYYQPEAYIPQTDTFIEKDSAINEEIEKLRLSATAALVSRRDVVVVSSVSCIYGLGSPEDFKNLRIQVAAGKPYRRQDFLEKAVEILYDRNDVEFKHGVFRVRGDCVDIYPSYTDTAYRITWWGDDVESIKELEPLTGHTGDSLPSLDIYPASSHVTDKTKIEPAFRAIREELEGRVTELEVANKLVEAQRIRMRTEYDLEMLREVGFCNGVENYSRHLAGRLPGTRPECLIDYLSKDTLIFIDESHVSWPQIGGMSNGDRARKQRLVDYGFRLPSALDNRPMLPDEFLRTAGQVVFVSATPAPYELEKSAVIAEQVVRPTGLIDPSMEVRPIEGQVENLIGECLQAAAVGDRVLVTTLTKRMSEDLATYLKERGLKVEYLHSDIAALDRVDILRKLRGGEFQVLIGVNLLREGLDLPEVALVAILDADKEGFLRSTTSIIQTAGRAARHEKGRVILYADVMTDSLKKAIEITDARRTKQLAYNAEHGITPKGVRRALEASMQKPVVDPVDLAMAEGDADVAGFISTLEAEMLQCAEDMDFERAATLRDQIKRLRGEKNKLSAKKRR